MRPLRIAVAVEGRLPSPQADAEAVVNSASALARRGHRVAILHAAASIDPDGIREYYGVTGETSLVPLRNPFGQRTAQHVLQALRVPSTREFEQCDVVLTRGIPILALALARGKPVLFDHYRPFPSQRPSLQPLLRRWMTHPEFLGIACHSDVAAASYRRIGIPGDRVRVVRNGFEPRLLEPALERREARVALGLEPSRDIVTYTGRVNERKGLDVLLGAAARLPETLFLLVGSAGEDNEIERAASALANVRLVPWQRPDAVSPYLYASDVVLIPPSENPMARYGRTVLPLKAYLYLGSGRPILAGDTPDVAEVLRDGVNALLVPADDVEATATGILRLLRDRELASRLAAAAGRDARRYTWDARAERLEAFIEDRMAGPRIRTVEAGWSTRAWVRECLGLSTPPLPVDVDGGRAAGG